MNTPELTDQQRDALNKLGRAAWELSEAALKIGKAQNEYQAAHAAYMRAWAHAVTIKALKRSTPDTPEPHRPG